MADFPPEFENAFNHAMLYEVGAFWDPTDPDVIDGRIATREQRRKVGYVNIPQDRGGETKYGVAQKANPDVPVRDLNLYGAQAVYFYKYWLVGKCDRMPYPLTIIHFDGCVNHGPSRAARFLQSAAGVEADGVIGNQTLQAIAEQDQATIIQNIAAARTQFYHDIVARNPSQQIFLNGWLRRITEVTDYTLAALG